MQNGKSVKAQPFGEHVRELRQRLIYVALTLFIGCIAGYVMHKQLFTIITRPLGQPLYYTTPTGGFNALIKISILFGLLVTIPVLIYHTGKFLSPAFRHKFKAKWILLAAVILGLMGVLFAYYLSLPAALHFLANIDSQNLQSLITINEYLSFAFGYVFGFALIFQLPLILLFINRIKPQRPGTLMRIERWVVLSSFVFAAILTPTPDPMNQLIMALPIILLYQFSVLLIWYVNRGQLYGVETENTPSLVPETRTQSAASSPPTPPSVLPPASAPALAPQAPKPTEVPRSSKPKLIMDIFWVPPAPAS